MGAVGSHWKHDLKIVRFAQEGCAFSIGSRVGAVGSRYKNIYFLLMDVCIQRCKPSRGCALSLRGVRIQHREPSGSCRELLQKKRKYVHIYIYIKKYLLLNVCI